MILNGRIFGGSDDETYWISIIIGTWSLNFIQSSYFPISTLINLSVKFFDRKRKNLTKSDGKDLFKEAEFIATHNSYTPYTKLRSSVVIVTDKTSKIWGVPIENMAFNPSLGPMHCALSQLRFFQQEKPKRVLFYQEQNQLLDLEKSARTLLESEFPELNLESSTD